MDRENSTSAEFRTDPAILKFFEKFSKKYKRAIATYSIAICRKAFICCVLMQKYAKNDFGSYSKPH